MRFSYKPRFLSCKPFQEVDFTSAKYFEELFQVDGEPYDGKLSRTVRERAHP